MADSLTEEELSRLEALHAEAIAERDGRICTMVAASRFLQELAHHAPALLASARAVRKVEALRHEWALKLAELRSEAENERACNLRNAEELHRADGELGELKAKLAEVERLLAASEQGRIDAECSFTHAEKRLAEVERERDDLLNQLDAINRAGLEQDAELASAKRGGAAHEAALRELIDSAENGPHKRLEAALAHARRLLGLPD